jgi:exodeoxyribonuclease V beta subunit
VSGPTTFDITGPLPEGLTLLEASAGTGKTWTIAALVARYVADGVPVEHLLVVTFTRIATGELRERVRDRLVATEAGLRAALDRRRAVAVDDPGEATTGDRGEVTGGDPVVDLLATGTVEEVERRRRRLATALADFDAATIATTHGFCEQILAGLGTAGDVERVVTFVAESTDLVDEVVDDLYIRKWYRQGTPPFDRAAAVAIGRLVVRNPEAPIVPLDAPGHPVAETRARMAEAVRREVEARKRRQAMLGYDDLQTRLADTLRSDTQGAVACARLQERYRVVLVDEFQDTDPIQWEILERAFATGPTTLVLIGDPKQAIYSFRGADVWAYLAAARAARTTATLGTNWRSDQALVDGLDALLGGASLGHPAIVARPVVAGPAAGRPRLEGAPDGASLRARVLHVADGQVVRLKKGSPSKPSARAVVATDLAADVVRLLSAGAALVTRDAAGAETGRRDLRPADVAVLVQTNDEATIVRTALDLVGVPAVVHGAGSVMATPVAGQWLQLLEALERPASPTRARAAALTVFVGWSAADVAAADDARLGDLQAMLHRWAAVLAHDGVAALQELVTVSCDLPARLLARTGGERQLTDLRHVGQLLHAEATAARLGTTALTAWLRQRIALPGSDGAVEDRARRLDSDADAVAVITVHRSKGLEFPVVYLPYLWASGWTQSEPLPVYHDPDHGDRRTVDVGGPDGPGNGAHTARHVAELRGEDLRKAYVALTRGRHQVVVWWAGVTDSGASALGRLLMRRPDGAVGPTPSHAPSDDSVTARWEALAAGLPGRISVARVDATRGPRWSPPTEPAVALTTRTFDRSVDTDWRRVSYTSVTAPAHGPLAADPPVGSEPEDPDLADEGIDRGGDDLVGGVDPGAPTEAAVIPAPGGAEDGAGLTGPASEGAARASLWADVPGGTALGTLVHAVLEAVDFADADLEGGVATAVTAAVASHAAVPGLDDAMLAAGLVAAIRTPLGTRPDDLALCDVAGADRLDELGFELPLAGGDHPTGALDVAAIAATVAAWLPADDPLAAYPARLADPALAGRLRGYLTGSIDAVVRRRDPATGGERFVVVDYKTNRLGRRGEPLTTVDYRPAVLADAMLDAHYPLQALLYAVALHRFLRWRLAGYRPETHLGGVAYLFVRGMVGPDTPVLDGGRCGVFSWEPPTGLVAALSDLFDVGGPTPGGTGPGGPGGPGRG